MSTEVECVVGRDGHVRCGTCSHLMQPMEYEAVGADEASRPWLFWACLGPERHVSAMVPLPSP
jgi:hypothetical protein